MSFFFIDDAAGVSSLSYVGTADSSASTITIPATSQTGDIAILYDLAVSGSIPTLVTPSGWTNRLNTTGSTFRLAVCSKILEAGEPGASITGMNGATVNNKMMMVFRPNIPIGTATFSTFTGETGPADPASQSILASGQPAPVLVIAGCGASAGPSFSTASPAFDADVAASSPPLRMGYKIYNAGSTPADHTIDMADLGARNSLWGGYITVN